jgi:hypothetical protein
MWNLHLPGDSFRQPMVVIIIPKNQPLVKCPVKYSQAARSPDRHFPPAAVLHGAAPTSVGCCREIGLDCVSCSPFRVPIARPAAARAADSQHLTFDGKTFIIGKNKRKKESFHEKDTDVSAGGDALRDRFRMR